MLRRTLTTIRLPLPCDDADRRLLLRYRGPSSNCRFPGGENHTPQICTFTDGCANEEKDKRELRFTSGSKRFKGFHNGNGGVPKNSSWGCMETPSRCKEGLWRLHGDAWRCIETLYGDRWSLLADYKHGDSTKTHGDSGDSTESPQRFRKDQSRRLGAAQCFVFSMDLRGVFMNIHGYPWELQGDSRRLHGDLDGDRSSRIDARRYCAFSMDLHGVPMDINRAPMRSMEIHGDS